MLILHNFIWIGYGRKLSHSLRAEYKSSTRLLPWLLSKDTRFNSRGMALVAKITEPLLILSTTKAAVFVMSVFLLLRKEL